MQNKGLVKFLLIVMVIVSAIQFLYMIPTNRVEAEAKEYAENKVANISDSLEKNKALKEEQRNYLDSISDETIFSVPMIKSWSYDEMKGQQLALGLDLKGGMSVVLQVRLRELLETLSNNNKDRTFNDALAAADAAQSSSQSDYITLFADEFNKIADGKKLSKIFDRSPTIGSDINIETSDAQVISILRQKADETVSLTFDRLKRRIEGLGVSQPNISLDAGRDLILIELPGIDNQKRAMNVIGSVAELEFWETYRFTDNNLINSFIQADQRLADALGTTAETNDDVVEMDTIVNYTYDDLGNAIDSTITTQAKAKDPFSASSQGPLLSNLQLNGRNGQALYAQTVMGVAPRNKKKVITELLARPDIKELFPANSIFMWGQQPYVDYETREETGLYELYLIKTRPGSTKAPLEGDVIVDASQSPDPTTGQPQVSLRMNQKGAQIWGEMTTKAFNDNQREIAITLDKEVVSAPGLRNGPITGGSSSISGNFTVQEARDLANILEIGKLPAKTEVLQQNNVGPSLGQKNIISSRNSLIAGFILLMLFMILYYGGAGIVSILSLLFNVFFIFGALASFGTVLTLPGIAGIVLTIGMAVDANVIIYERVKEELRAGKSLLASIQDGFSNSYSAIIDANVTTILTAIVLAYFGLGPIKGFAVVLIIGVISSLFTAVLVGKWLIDTWTSKGRSISFWMGWSKNILANLQVDWLGKRKIGYAISGIIILGGIISMVTRGFDLGVDFKGGYSYNIEFPTNVEVDASTLKSGLEDYFGSAPTVKAVSVENTFNVVTSYNIDDTDETAASKVMAKLHEGIAAITGSDVPLTTFENADAAGTLHVVSSSKVGPTIADDIKNSSIKAGVFALLLIFLYIFIRFSKWQYSLGAVMALFHDSAIVLGLFSILWGIVPFSLEIDQAFIAAILTIIGYSINDTVVVFDRIREYMGIYTNKTKDEVINMAINSTFSRTVITSLTTLLVVGTLFLFGGGSIRGFAFALLIGILVGTYSSIFVATPIVRDLSDDLKVSSSSSAAKSSDKSFTRAKK